MNKHKYIQDKFTIMGIALSDIQIQQFVDYSSILGEWNSVMNLTAIIDFEEIVEKHFLDSLAISLIQNVSRETFFRKLIDVGTGAGFPGVPLKIVYPELEVTLLDSLNKRIKFLDTVIDRLDLEDIVAIHGRAEDMAHKVEYREKFGLCISRAVANLSTLSEYCLPFIHKEGRFFAYKSGDIHEELKNASKAIDILGGTLVETRWFKLPGTEIQRSLIVIEKLATTASKYPRKAGLPQKQPL